MFPIRTPAEAGFPGKFDRAQSRPGGADEHLLTDRQVGVTWDSYAGMVELVDTRDLKSLGTECCPGSSPGPGITKCGSAEAVKRPKQCRSIRIRVPTKLGPQPLPSVSSPGPGMPLYS